MTEKSNLENAKMEIAHPGKYQNGKSTTWKIPEWKYHAPENYRKMTPWKMTECTIQICQNGKCSPWKMSEWKLHTPQSDRKITNWKMIEKSNLKNDRMEI